MNLTTIFIGPQSSGKTTALKALAKGKKAVFVNYDERSPWALSEVNEDTELICMDDPNISLKNLRYLLSADTIVINKLDKPAINIARPSIAIAFNNYTETDLQELGPDNLSRATIIKL